MTPEFEIAEASRALVSENAAILNRFESEGINLTKAVRVAFESDFSSEEEARGCGELFSSYRKADENPFCFGSCFPVYVTDPDSQLFVVQFSGEMKLDAEILSRSECRLDLLVAKFGGSRITWEFENSENGTSRQGMN
ncbi:MAG: ribonuclease E inhibitor RraB [Sulfitobacter sp.]